MTQEQDTHVELASVMASQTVSTVAMPDSAKAAREVQEGIKANPNIALVPVASPWTSKVNWTQVIGVAAMLATFFGWNITPGEQAQIITAIGAVSGVITIIWKTFFTNSVTAASAGK